MTIKDLVLAELRLANVPTEWLAFEKSATFHKPIKSRACYPTLIFLANYAKALKTEIIISSLYRTKGSHITYREADIWIGGRKADSMQTYAQLCLLSDLYKLRSIINCLSVRAGHYLDYPINSGLGSATKTTGNFIYNRYETDKDIISKNLYPAGDRGNLSGGIHFALGVNGVKPMVEYSAGQRNATWDRTTRSANNFNFRNAFYDIEGNFNLTDLKQICAEACDQIIALFPQAEIGLK